ncbi:MAG TPA: ABC transporter substrate-binding protein [Pseudonocardiaceae bacterium]|jgi:peptide/nickel transport system substrate-binding protein|nr:ABC transporter substrate-binding protein [Pseudonocardiaceae bacterium]
MRRTGLTLVSMAAAGVLVAACGTGGTPGTDASTGQTSQAATPPDSRLNLNATVNIQLALEPTSLNIFSTAGAALDQILLDNVYQELVSVNPADKDAIVPELATSWNTSPDGLTYTFHLVHDATFHDHTPLTAADVVWSLDQQIAPGSIATYASSYSSIASVAAPDPYTVRINLKHRDTFLLWNLTQRGGIVFKQGTRFTSLSGAENGSGPFTLAQWNRGSSITLSRDSSYWGPKPKVATVVFHYISDPNAANNAERTGQTDIETRPDPTLLQPFAGNSGFTVLRGSTTDKYTLAFNDAVAPFTNPDVRHAIRQAIDNADVISAFGAGTLIGSDVPPQDPWYADLTSIDAHNPANAKKLLAAAGYPNGLNLTLTVPNIYHTTISDVVTSELKQVGINVTVKQVEFQTWLSQVFTNHQFQLSIVDHAEARDIYNYANPQYYFGYHSPQVQQWYAQAQTAGSDADRNALLAKVARQISTDAASDWLFLAQAITIVRTGVYGVPTVETTNRYDLSTLAVAR